MPPSADPRASSAWLTDGLRALERARLRPVAVSAACLAENSRRDTGAGLRDSQMNG